MHCILRLTGVKRTAFSNTLRAAGMNVSKNSEFLRTQEDNANYTGLNLFKQHQNNVYDEA